MTKKENDFVEAVWNFYRSHGRGHLPWRETTDPYRILVSELMLQQTQVERVIPKYRAFIKQWSTVSKLANTTLADVLIAWQGLGYNRRARYLHECAKVIVKEHDSVFPDTYESLQTLPGIGPYTAGAVCAFAYNQPVVLIETNVRTVFIHHFFTGQENVVDTDILRLVEKTLPKNQSREWYAALMDYGSHLKKTVGNINTRSKHYTQQTKFAGSDREIRGAILRYLATELTAVSNKKLYTALQKFEVQRIKDQVTALSTEGLIVCTARTVRLPS